MGFFDDIGNAFKSAVTAVGDVANTVVEAAGDVAGWTANVVGEGVEGVTRVVAGDEAADAVKKTFDENIEPGIKRGVEGVASIIATPLTAIDDVLEKGIIDGLTSNTLEATQDIIGGVTRTVAGEQVEQSFDKVYDEQIQPIAETVIGTAARIGAMVVPGGQLLLAADAGSEFASLGYRAATGEQLGVADYVGAGASVLALGGGAAMGALTKVGSKVGTEVAETAAIAGTKVGTEVAETAAIASTKVGTEVAEATATKVGANIATKASTATDDVAITSGTTIAQATREAAIGEAQGQLEGKVQEQVTLAIEREIQQGQAQEVAGGFGQQVNLQGQSFYPRDLTV